jgi:hypothetical protein
MSPSLFAYLMLECSMVALQDDDSQAQRYDEILCAMDSLWWGDLSDVEHDALNDVIRADVQTHVSHERVL